MVCAGRRRSASARDRAAGRHDPRHRRSNLARLSAAVTVDYREFYRGRRVLITGGLGFIGSNLARLLVDLEADVLIVDALLPDSGGSLFNIAGIESRLHVNLGDVRQPSAMNHLV